MSDHDVCLGWGEGDDSVSYFGFVYYQDTLKYMI